MENKDLVVSKPDYKKEMAKLKVAEQAIERVYQDRKEIVEEIIRLAEADLSKDLDVEIVKQFMKGLYYADENIKEHYQDAFRLRDRGLPVLTDRKNQTYKIPDNLDDLKDVEVEERKKMIKKVSRLYYTTKLNPKRIYKEISKKTDGAIE